jgi:hypothetical protein
MIEKQIIEYLRLLHGSFNTALWLVLLYHGWTGLKIRTNRLKGAPDFSVIKGHRKRGPFLALMGIAGFLFGPTLLYVDQGKVFQFPAHAIVGAFIAISLVVLFVVSRHIKAGPQWRTPHFVLGLWVLCLYVAQILLGLDVLF